MIRQKLIWAPLALCLVPLLHGCGSSGSSDTTTTNTTTTASSNDATNSASNDATNSASSGDTTKTADASTAFAPDKVPPTPELAKLTKETLLAWNEGIQAKDFTKFYSTISKLWQKQTTPEKLAEGFKPITDQNEKGTNIEPFINKMEPVFTPAPAINSDGLLVVQGYYPSTPSRTTFTLKYVPEETSWKLAGIDVSMHKAPAGDAKDAPAKDDAPAPAKDDAAAPAKDAPAKDTP